MHRNFGKLLGNKAVMTWTIGDEFQRWNIDIKSHKSPPIQTTFCCGIFVHVGMHLYLWYGIIVEEIM